jgi:choline kinase
MNLIVEDSNMESSHAPLNVVIPIGGIGSRFQKVGYRYPKPLINIVGRPMLFWVIERLEFKPKDTLWIAYDGKIDDEFHLGEMVVKEFPTLDIRLVRLNYSTRGAAETVSLIHQTQMRELIL